MRPLLGRVLYIKIIVKIIRDCEVDLVYNPVPGPLGPFVQKGGYPDTPLTNSFLKKYIYINNPPLGEVE